MTPIIVVSVLFRAPERVRAWARALERARSELGADAHRVSVIAVDNAPEIGAAALLQSHSSWISVVAQESNIGFAAGCNVGLRMVAADALVVLLNPDVIVEPDFFVTLARVDWPADLAAIGPLVRGANGEVEQSARAFPSLRTGAFGRTTLLSRLLPQSALARGQLLAGENGGVRTVDWVSGACLIIPADRLALVGRLDEGYWMYWEDADWCRRAYDRGLRVEYHPELRVRHYQGTSSAVAPLRTTVAFHRSALRYYRLHVSRAPPESAAAALLLAARLGAKLGGRLMLSVAPARHGRR